MDLTTPNGGGILQNLKGSLLNSLSYLTSRNQNSSVPSKRGNNNKENSSTPLPNKTPKSPKSTDFYNMKTPKIAGGKRKILKSGNFLLEEEMEGNDETEMSTDMSSLRISTGSERKKNRSKNSIDNSNDIDNNSKSSAKNQVEEIDASIPQTSNEEIQNEIDTTPFITQRKKRNIRKSLQNVASQGFPETPVKNSRSSRRETLMMNKNKQEIETDLKNKKETHDKNKEIELVTSTTPRPARKFATKTPAKPDVFISPFVNTRPRRRSTLKAIEEDKIETDNGATRRSCRISRRQSINTPNKNDEDPISYELNKNRSASKPKNLRNILEEDENSTNKSLEPVVVHQDDLVSPPSIGKSSRKTKITTPDEEDACTTPKQFKYEDNQKELSIGKQLRSSRRSRNVTTSSTPKIVQNNCADGKNEDKGERKSRRRTTRLLSQPTCDEDKIKIEDSDQNTKQTIQKKMSRSKSESNVKESTSKRTRRIRKLYDPDLVDSEEIIQERLGVNDQEERKTIREAKLMKVNVKDNLIGGRKAAEFLENTKNNVAAMFREPETVLEQLGIDKEKICEKKKESIVNNSDDEQVELAEEFVHKRLKKASHGSNAIPPTPKNNSSARNLRQKALTTGNGKRRSTMDFVPKPLSVPKSRTKLNLNEKPTIVCTKMHKADVQMFHSIVAKLGRFEVEDEVSARTTHLVVGEVKRTINMLRALSRGCWILRQEWLLSSLEHNEWLPEENYEATEFSKAVQQCRLRRQAFGPTYHMNIFLDCGTIYVARSTMPRCSDIRELITLCEGKVTKIPDNAKISVGTYLEGCDCVNEFWVLDSVTAGKLEPLEEYAITAESAKTKSPFV